MNLTRTCHLTLPTVVAKTCLTKARLMQMRLAGLRRKRSPAEDMFFMEAQQRLEESARMLSAARHAGFTTGSSVATADDSSSEQVLLTLEGHRRSHYTGARVAPAHYAAPQSQETHEAIHAA
jgi:hypothetical protein